jgi:DNA-binding response OmpR family regulator
MMELSCILLVEDNPYDAELIMTGFEENNLANRVLNVRDGEEALDYLYCRGKYNGRMGGNPAVILLDLNLPKVNGFEVLRQIRADENLNLIPVVILTSSREDKDVINGYSLGTNGYVVKPIDFHQFVDTIKQLGAFWAVVNQPPPGSACLTVEGS